MLKKIIVLFCAFGIKIQILEASALNLQQDQATLEQKKPFILPLYTTIHDKNNGWLYIFLYSDGSAKAGYSTTIYKKCFSSVQEARFLTNRWFKNAQDQLKDISAQPHPERYKEKIYILIDYYKTIKAPITQ